MVVITDYYHMTTVDENVNWMKITHILSTFTLNLRGPFCTSTFTSKFLIIFLNAHLEKNNASPLCVLCKLMPQFTPLLTLTLVHMWYKNSPPRATSQRRVDDEPWEQHVIHLLELGHCSCSIDQFVDKIWEIWMISCLHEGKICDEFQYPFTLKWVIAYDLGKPSKSDSRQQIARKQDF